MTDVMWIFSGLVVYTGVLYLFLAVRMYQRVRTLEVQMEMLKSHLRVKIGVELRNNGWGAELTSKDERRVIDAND